ncbi:MAG: ATP-dependent RecD-like DNA helicase [Clostridia bacterium]|jgi:exodeoxyribonuclease V alpha subunit|nr:ATP-dependent RecD-like DNA helicase [Clostridia bacterium]
MKFSGTVESVIFQNIENGYSVIDVSVDGFLYTAVGNMPPMSEGENVEIDGEIKENPKYGEQIAVRSVKKLMPNNKEGMIRFLSSELFSGVGYVLATSIVEAFGDKTFDVIEKEPLLLARLKGINIKKAMQISDAFTGNKAMQEVIVAFSAYEISVAVALKIYKAYGANAVKKVEENPYILINDIEGIGFKKADKIAMSLGIEKDSAFRIKAGICYVLSEVVVKNGHTHLPKDILIAECLDILELKRDEYEELIVSAIDELEIIGRVTLIDRDGYTAVILSKHYIAEKSIATKLVYMMNHTPPLMLDIDGDIKEYERINEIVLHENQKLAIKNCLRAGVNVITGGPGTGKTTIIRCIIGILKSQGYTVSLAAPTGRAAKRLSEATGEQAKTVHRMLDLDFKDGKGYFTYNENFRLSSDVIIVDEVSMCDEYMFNALIKSIKNGGRLIMVGDKDQLPSVGAGNVLADIIGADGIVPVSYLTQIYRQENDKSLIVENAHRINRGEMPKIDNSSKDFFFDMKSSPKDIADAVISMVTERIPKYKGVLPKDIQVLCPMKKGVAGVEHLNVMLQETLNPRDISKNEVHIGNFLLREGDKVIHTVNNYNLEWIKLDDMGDTAESGMGVFNGDIGYIKSIEKNNGKTTLTVEFDDLRIAKYDSEAAYDLLLAYAISVHKSQGSEFPIAIIAVTAGNYMILTRNLLYTAVTRAKEMVVLIGDKDNVAKMVRNNYTQKRYSMLKDFIIEENSRRC